MIKENPVLVMPSDTRGSQTITASDVDQALHLALYKPLKSVKLLFHSLHNLTIEYGSWFADVKSNSMQPDIAELSKSCKDASPWTPECPTSGVLDSTGGLAIERTDGEDLQVWS